MVIEYNISCETTHRKKHRRPIFIPCGCLRGLCKTWAGGVIGEVPREMQGLGLRAHQETWQDHADAFGHHVDVVFHQKGGAVAYEIDPLAETTRPNAFSQVVYTRSRQ